VAATLIVPVVDQGLGNPSYLVDLGDGRALAVDAPRDPRAARTDLSGPEQAEPLARAQYASLRRLLTLPEATPVYPTHQQRLDERVLVTTFGPWAVAAVLLGAGTAMVYPTLLGAVGEVAHPAWRAWSVGVYRLWRGWRFRGRRRAGRGHRGRARDPSRDLGRRRAHCRLGPGRRHANVRNPARRRHRARPVTSRRKPTWEG
jgi:hypothetical protein